MKGGGLSPRQFPFQGRGDKPAPFVGEHRAEPKTLSGGFDDDVSAATGITVSVAPPMVFHADIPDSRQLKPLMKSDRSDSRKEIALTFPKQDFSPTTQAVHNQAAQEQTQGHKGRQEEPQKDNHAQVQIPGFDQSSRKPGRYGDPHFVQSCRHRDQDKKRHDAVPEQGKKYQRKPTGQRTIGCPNRNTLQIAAKPGARGSPVEVDILIHGGAGDQGRQA